MDRNEQELLDDESGLTPSEIVRELDRYIISQEEAKKSVAIALRNRWRRLRVPAEFREEITPKNIIMIGPTGVGKTEISRRLAKLVKAPFVKVEASKFTEVGYVGRDVDSIIRDLVESAHTMIREEERKRVRGRAEQLAEERLLDLLLPGSKSSSAESGDRAGIGEPEEQITQDVFYQDESGLAHPGKVAIDTRNRTDTRDKLRELLKAGKLEDRIVEVEIVKQASAQMQVLGPQGFGEIEGQIKEMFSNMLPRSREVKRLAVREARQVLAQEAQDTLIDGENIARLAVRRAEQTGIVFIDEIDKICGKTAGQGPDVSREGVQRDLLPLVEGSTVGTKYGAVHTEHILFIASGAFHSSKPSDLMPEFQGRFPIRVELKSLSADDFVRILTEPQNALTRQYQELLRVEKVELEFAADGIQELAKMTAQVNSRTENIGARRLHTLLEKTLEDISFNAESHRDTKVVVDAQYVRSKIQHLIKDMDLAQFIL